MLLRHLSNVLSTPSPAGGGGFKRFAHSARPGKVNWRKSITAFYVSFLLVGSVGIVGMDDLFSSVGLVICLVQCIFFRQVVLV